jgi:protein gp37
MQKTKIEWADATWNPITGCTKVSEGCRNCYAERIFLNPQVLAANHMTSFNDIQFHPERLADPLEHEEPQTIFVCSMSDLFNERVPEETIKRIFDVMYLADQHTFLVLTKRAYRMAELAPKFRWPANIYAGVSVEDQRHLGRLDSLRKVPAALRFVSFEPLLGPIPNIDLTGIGWVIVGGESGPHRRKFDENWARDIRDQCVKAGIPFFYKQPGGFYPGGDGVLDGVVWRQTPDDMRQLKLL